MQNPLENVVFQCKIALNRFRKAQKFRLRRATTQKRHIKYNSYYIDQKSAREGAEIFGDFHQLRKPPLIDSQSELRGGAFLSGIPLM